MRHIKIIFALIFVVMFFGMIQNAGAALPPPLGNPHAPKGGVFKIRFQGEPGTLNPIVEDGYGAAGIQFHIIEPLAYQDVNTYEWSPALAKSWKISDDGMVYDFTLRKNASWNDGRPFTAEDVKFSFDMLFDDRYPAAHIRPYYEGLKRVEILGPYKVRFYAKDNYFRNFISAAALPILPKHIYGDPKTAGSISDTLVGTGPYVLKEFMKGRRIVLEKNSRWWGNHDPQYPGKNNFKTLIFQFVGDDNVAIEMLKKGDLDYMPLSPQTYVELTNDDHHRDNYVIEKIENSYPVSMRAIGWNLSNPLFSNRSMRVALAHLMDRESMSEKFFYGLSESARGPWYNQSAFADPGVPAISFNPKLALELFREMGWRDSDGDQVLDKIIDGKKTDLKFTILTPGGDGERFLTVFKEDAKLAGVDVNIRVLGWDAIQRLLDDHNFDGVEVSWGGGVVDFDPKPSWHSSSAVKGGLNIIGYSNPVADELIDEARNIRDTDARIPVMQKLYRVIAHDAPYLFLFNDKYIMYAHSHRVAIPVKTFKYEIGTDYWWAQ
jgi:microcin C transport system substrate-binding protein